MINIFEVNETNKMIEQENLDVRTITMGISLLDCIDPDLDALNQKIYEKITTKARNLVATGDEIATEYGIPVVNKRISVTPIALVGGAACKKPEDFVTIARTLDKCAKEVGVNFIGGYSALVSKGMTPAEELLIRSIPQAMAETERVCSSVNVGSTKTGINMDAVKLMGDCIFLMRFQSDLWIHARKLQVTSIKLSWTYRIKFFIINRNQHFPPFSVPKNPVFKFFFYHILFLAG